jgi:putative SOS response-associated peptidase YedK
MREIHDRMPVILDSAGLNNWLNPEIHEPNELREMMKPCPDEWLSSVEVSPW